jgi:hypothetical protein
MFICLRENVNHFEQKKTVLRIKSRNTETMDNRFHHICPGRSSGLQIILAKGRAFPSADYGQWHHAAGKSLLTAPVQRYGF